MDARSSSSLKRSISVWEREYSSERFPESSCKRDIQGFQSELTSICGPPSVKKARNDICPERSKDNKKPCRPLSAYNIFFREERQRLIKSGESIEDIYQKEVAPSSNIQAKDKFQSLVKVVSQRWNKLSLDDRQPYEQMALVEKKNYQQKLSDFRTQEFYDLVSHHRAPSSRKETIVESSTCDDLVNGVQTQEKSENNMDFCKKSGPSPFLPHVNDGQKLIEPMRSTQDLVTYGNLSESESFIPVAEHSLSSFTEFNTSLMPAPQELITGNRILLHGLLQESSIEGSRKEQPLFMAPRLEQIMSSPTGTFSELAILLNSVRFLEEQITSNNTRLQQLYQNDPILPLVSVQNFQSLSQPICSNLSSDQISFQGHRLMEGGAASTTSRILMPFVINLPNLNQEHQELLDFFNHQQQHHERSIL